MISLVQILEGIRKQRRMKPGMLWKHLGISEDAFKRIRAIGDFDDRLLVPWCQFLELGIKDYEPLRQYQARYTLFRVLQKQLGLSPYLTKLIADITFFREDIPADKIYGIILPSILPKIQALPYHLSKT